MPTPKQREDGRAHNEIRPPRCELALLERADGSTKFDFGDKTQALVAVYGPTEVPVRNEQLDSSTIQVVFRPIIGSTTVVEKAHEQAVREMASYSIAKGLHPRTLIEIVVQVTGDDGSILATAINATTLALIDAGVPLTRLIVSLSCAVSNDGALLADPTTKETQDATSIHTFAFDSTTKKVILSDSIGIFTEDEYLQCLDVCRRGSEKIQAFIRRGVQMRVEKAIDAEEEEDMEVDGDDED